MKNWFAYKKLIHLSTSTLHCVTHTNALSRFLIVKPCDSTEYARTISFYHNRCNQLEKWLSNGNYKQKLAREQTLKARAVSMDTLLNNKSKPQVMDHLVHDLTQPSLLKGFQKVLNEVLILLTLMQEQNTEFGEKPPMIRWRNARILQDYLLRTKTTNGDTEERKSARCM